jgi:hypothetical protein
MLLKFVQHSIAAMRERGENRVHGPCSCPCPCCAVNLPRGTLTTRASAADPFGTQPTESNWETGPPCTDKQRKRSPFTWICCRGVPLIIRIKLLQLLGKPQNKRTWVNVTPCIPRTTDTVQPPAAPAFTSPGFPFCSCCSHAPVPQPLFSLRPLILPLHSSCHSCCFALCGSRHDPNNS